MRAIKIDAREKTVTEVEVPPGTSTLTFMQQVVGGFIETARNFHEDQAGPGCFDTVYVNEEGLLHGDTSCWFTWDGAHQPFVGNGVVMGVDADGETTSPTCTLEEARAAVKFLSREDVRRLFERATSNMVVGDAE